MTGLTTVTGTLAEAEALFTLHNDEKVNLGSSPSIAITLSDTNVSVAHVNTLSAQTSGAKLVEYIFTTDANMKQSYTEKTGNENVYALPFAAQPMLHKPAPLKTRKPKACFAGSWYGNLSTLKTLTDEFSNNVYTLTITDSGTAAASDINSIKAVNTNGTITASNITTVTGTAADVITAYSNVTTGCGNEALNINSGTITVSQARSLNALTSSTVTGEIVNTSRISAILDSSTGITESGGSNAYTITIASADAAASASDLNSINDLTTVAVNLTNVTSLTSSSLTDLGTLATAITNNELSNDTGITTIAVSNTTIAADT
jgi:hypothetical protein